MAGLPESTSSAAPAVVAPPSGESAPAAVLGASDRLTAAWARRSSWVGMAVLASLYYASAKLGYVFEFSGPVASIVWLPAGVGIAFLSLFGLGFWPGVLVGDLLVNDYTLLPLGSAVGQTAGNVLEVVLAAYLIRRIRRTPALGSVGGVARVLGAIAAGTALSATVGVLSARLGDVVMTGGIPTIWRTWWLGDTAGALILVPLALAWSAPAATRWWRARAVEGGLLLAVTVGLCELVLQSGRPLTYLVFPVLVWAALRFGQRGATLAVTVTAALTVWNTTHYVGPFVFHSITRSVLSTQLFLAVASISTLCLAAVVEEREEFARRLRASRVRLVEAADAERRRLERNLHDGAQQRLTALALRLREIAEDSPDAAATRLEDAESELQVAIDELRELAHGIHPSVLANFGLADAIRSLVSRSTIPIAVSDLPAGRLDETVETTAYYFLAEAVTNAQRYARATEIRVRAAESPDGLRIEIVDDGIGGAVERSGSGLQGLRDRVEAIGGTFELESPPGRGTRVAALIPVPA
jgi:signal transduction histidine kinase